MRQIILDTETTGLSPETGHRIIEIGCMEMIDRRLTGNNFHIYINPQREVEAAALEVHGITNQFLAGKPVFTDIIEAFIEYITNTELIIHNAEFDVGFLNHEFTLAKHRYQLSHYCQVFDTLTYARKKHPGQRNSLDALCKRYNVDNSNRDLHGALVDAELLAFVYLAMTGGQSSLFGGESDINPLATVQSNEQAVKTNRRRHQPLPVILASEKEQTQHQAFLEMIQSQSDKKPLWLETETEPETA